jgi:hypothetical protein
MFWYIKNNQVFLKEKFEVLPEIIALTQVCSPQRIVRIYDYLHFTYSKKSAYFTIPIKDRKRKVCNDRFENDFRTDPSLPDKIEQSKEVQAVIRAVNEFQFSENEHFLEGVRKKISEYLTYWENNPITKDNAEDIKAQLKGAKELLIIKKEMEMMVYEELRKANSDRESGKKLFEE